MKHGFRLLIVALVALAGTSLHAQTGDIDTQLMVSTFKVSTPESTGTAFALRRPDPDDPRKTRFVLVTADHVLRHMKAEEATILYRRREADGGYAKVPAKLKVRQGEKPLWTKHPTADVAVMDFSPPPEVSALLDVPTVLLANDADLTHYEVHPGDLIRCVGFPHPNQFEANDFGFGVTRLGCIASYPLLPTSKTGTFRCDLNSFEGDSGSPVYLSEGHRVYGGNANPRPARLILGLVVGQHFIDEEYKMIYTSGKFRHRLGMAVVVHASAIRETIELLPHEQE